MKNIEINENIPHCLIQDYLLYNLNLFEAKKQRKKKAYNGNPLKFIERRAYFLYFYFDQSSRKKGAAAAGRCFRNKAFPHI
jgi:hypothetical protein